MTPPPLPPGLIGLTLLTGKTVLYSLQYKDLLKSLAASCNLKWL